MMKTSRYVIGSAVLCPLISICAQAKMLGSADFSNLTEQNSPAKLCTQPDSASASLISYGSGGIIYDDEIQSNGEKVQHIYDSYENNLNHSLLNSLFTIAAMGRDWSEFIFLIEAKTVAEVATLNDYVENHLKTRSGDVTFLLQLVTSVQSELELQLSSGSGDVEKSSTFSFRNFGQYSRCEHSMESVFGESTTLSAAAEQMSEWFGGDRQDWETRLSATTRISLGMNNRITTASGDLPRRPGLLFEADCRRNPKHNWCL